MHQSFLFKYVEYILIINYVPPSSYETNYPNFISIFDIDYPRGVPIDGPFKPPGNLSAVIFNRYQEVFNWNFSGRRGTKVTCENFEYVHHDCVC